MNLESKIKLWMGSIPFVESDLDRVEHRHALDLERPERVADAKDRAYYPQFAETLRASASSMARHYEIFYCLENTIRQLIDSRLTELHGPEWWDSHVPEPVRDNVRKNIKREADAGLTPRSDAKLDYTTFGELGDIVRENWGDFPEIDNERAFSKIMSSLNNLRGPIAHCCQLEEDEIVRLQLSIRDWFRLLGRG